MLDTEIMSDRLSCFTGILCQKSKRCRVSAKTTVHENYSRQRKSVIGLDWVFGCCDRKRKLNGVVLRLRISDG